MSYRTCINGVQIFGNNESYPEWIEFIQSQEIVIDEDGNYEGEIHDFMSALECIESIVMRLEKERQTDINELKIKEKNNTDVEKEEYFYEVLHNPNSRFYKSSMFDLSFIYRETAEALKAEDNYENSLFDLLYQFIKDGYIFMPYNFFKACEDVLEQEHVFSKDKHFHCYKIKDGKTIHVKAC